MATWITPFTESLSAHPGIALLAPFLAAFGEALLMTGAFVPSTVMFVGLGTPIGLGSSHSCRSSRRLRAILLANRLGQSGGVRWLDHVQSVWPFRRHPELLARGTAYIAHYPPQGHEHHRPAAGNAG